MSNQRMNEWIGEKKNHTYNFLHLNKMPIVALTHSEKCCEAKKTEPP